MIFMFIFDKNGFSSQRFTILLFSNRNPLAQMEEEKKEHEEKIQKMKLEMEQVFETKVQEKLKKLKDSETDVRVWID